MVELEGRVNLVDGVEDLVEVEIVCESHPRAFFNIECFSDTFEHLGTLLGLESRIGDQKIGKVILRNFSRALGIILSKFQSKDFFLE